MGLDLWDSSATRNPGGNQVRLPEAEQMIDELDRMLTTNGTIGVKSPDVWGQDRLAKFRSEYEEQMASWLKVGFTGAVNASVRRSESDARRLQLTASVADLGLNGSGKEDRASLAKNPAPAFPGATAQEPTSSDKPQVALEPTVLLDEHSNYLNHLNQLRRINAGDDLTDRPGYGLYLVRIPVTLSPGPRSRHGKGAIITVSAKSLMTRDTLRNALRNAVVTETVNNLTQAICSQPSNEADPSSGPSSGAFSLVSYADAELYYGPQNIALLRKEVEQQLARELSDEPHHRRARVSEWLHGELEAAYHMLEEAATPVRAAQLATASDPLEELGDLVVKRDYARIAALHTGGSGDPRVMRAGGSPAPLIADGPGGQRQRITSLLGFSLRIQAAAVNRRLKQDMADQDPKLKADELRRISFFDPAAGDEAYHLFQNYVNTKWPLRVYAIEPVIAQQNVADGFGRRMQSALDLAALSPVAPLRLLGGFSTDRRMADEEMAIRLNPTMVGFGAGENTFGWIFYPRLQTDGSSRGALFSNVSSLLHGHIPDPKAKQQSIEPGQRECTALIVMPNFIPRIEFITVANWFRTSDAGDGQKSDLEKASTLASMLVSAESALNRAKIEGRFRAEEYQIAIERLNQLRSLMPTQRLIVRVPFSDDNNDSRIFCSQGGQLRPSLMAWHGKPPSQGEESTIFVEGKNFSVHDTHVIAGGKPAKSVLVSRNVLEVTISPEACPTPSRDGEPLLDVNVATPNGVSNHLLIRMRPGCERKAPTIDSKATPESTEKLTKKDPPAEAKATVPVSAIRE